MSAMLFWRRRSAAAYSDGVIDLWPLQLWPAAEDLGFGQVYDFKICPAGSKREAGRISVRLGEGTGIYYFGHIGYHVDPPWRGHHFAARAGALVMPLMTFCTVESGTPERSAKSSLL